MRSKAASASCPVGPYDSAGKTVTIGISANEKRIPMLPASAVSNPEYRISRRALAPGWSDNNRGLAPRG
jgi:hypothetical protein